MKETPPLLCYALTHKGSIRRTFGKSYGACNIIIIILFLFF